MSAILLLLCQAKQRKRTRGRTRKRMQIKDETLITKQHATTLIIVRLSNASTQSYLPKTPVHCKFHQPRLFNTRLSPLNLSSASTCPDPLLLFSLTPLSLSSSFSAPTANTRSANLCAPAVYCSSLCAPSASLSILNSSDEAIVPTCCFVASRVFEGCVVGRSDGLLSEMLESRVWRWSA